MNAPDTTVAEIRRLEEDLEAVHSPEVRAFIQEKIESLSVHAESASPGAQRRKWLWWMKVFGVLIGLLSAMVPTLIDVWSAMTASFTASLNAPLIPAGYGQNWMSSELTATAYHSIMSTPFGTVLLHVSEIMLGLSVGTLLVGLLVERRQDKVRSKANGREEREEAESLDPASSRVFGEILREQTPTNVGYHEICSHGPHGHATLRLFRRRLSKS